MAQILKYPLLIIILNIGLSSCNRYIDQYRTLKSWPIMQGEMNFYSDSNVLKFKSNMIFRADTERWPAKPFYMQFPKRLKSYDFDYGSSFVFYFSNKQVIAVWINLMNQPNKPDSVYVPTEDEVETFRNAKLMVSDHKYNIRYIPYMAKRKQLMMRQKDAMILLFNIEPKNYETFLKRAQTFKLLY